MRRFVVGEAANRLSTRGLWPWYGSVPEGFEIRMGVAVGWFYVVLKKLWGKGKRVIWRGLD